MLNDIDLVRGFIADLEKRYGTPPIKYPTFDFQEVPDALLAFGRLWYGESDAISNAVGYAKFYSRSHDAVIRVYDEAGNVIETHEHTGDPKEW
jgi:hypothetical protein